MNAFGSLAEGYAKARPPLVERLARRTFGIDAVESMLRLAAGVAPEARFAAARAEQLPFRGGSIGLITAAGSLNHARLDRFFPEAARVLEADGLLAVYDFAPASRNESGHLIWPIWPRTGCKQYEHTSAQT